MAAWLRESPKNPGSRAIFFREVEHARPINLPCGRCEACRNARATEWSARCVLEASLHSDNCFLTLTYADDKLPVDGGAGHTLWPIHLVNFWKRLRRSLPPLDRDEFGGFVGGLKYLACGEYGDKSGRPHYHACVFNYRPDDLVFYKNTPAGVLYTSPKLAKIWGLGFVTVGDVTASSSSYVARYVMKKVYGPAALSAYALKVAPYLRASHGIAEGVPLTEFASDDRVGTGPGSLVPTPRYLLRKLAESKDPDKRKLFSEIKEGRAKSAARRAALVRPPIESIRKTHAARESFRRRDIS